MDPESNHDSRLEKLRKRSKWYWFQILSPTSCILRGSLSMSSNHFKFRSRGHQAAPSSIVAIVFARLFEPKNWTSAFIDQILEFGDKLFRTSQMRNRVNASEYMTTSLVFPEFFISDYKIRISTENSSIYGNLFSESVGCPDLSEGLERFFKIAEAGVVTAQGNSVAIWRHQEDGFFYFDPSPCSETGERNSEGVACIMRFKCSSDMLDIFLNNLNKKFDSRYCIDKISVLRVTPVKRGITADDKFAKLVVPKNVLRTLNPAGIPEETMDCTKTVPKTQNIVLATEITREPLSITISNYEIDKKFASEEMIDQNHFNTGYDYYDMEVNIPSTFKELPGGISILHGWTHEGSENYKGKGAQNVANCIMAIGVKKIHPVKTWLRPKLDDILLLADSVHAEVKSKKPSIKSLTAPDFDDIKIQIDQKNMFIDVDLITVIGTVSSKIPSVLNLKQALEEFFLVNKDGIVECPSMAVGIWTEDDYFYIFDPRQCDANGVRVVEEKGKSGGKGKKEATTVEKKVKGKCCVIRFSNIEDLVGHFVKNLPAGKKNDRFIIRHISMMDDVPGTRPWNEFKPAEAGKTWILQGSISNDSDDFEDESRGQQGIAMPIAALINATENPPYIWTRETVNDSIYEGNEFYNWCIPAEEEDNRELSLANLKKTLYNKHRKVKIDLQEATIVGDLKSPPNSQILNLENGISKFFETQQFGVVEAKDLAVGIWKYEEELKDKTKQTSYYVFDSNPRNMVGKNDFENMEGGEPASCVVRTLDPKELGHLIEGNVNQESENNDDFFIHGFKVVSISEKMSDEEIDADKKIPIKPDLNAYTELGEDGAIMNGSFDQGNIIFKPQSRNKQQAANALVTIAMRQMYSPYLWYREVIDDILKLGDKITQNNLQNLPEEGEEVEGEGKEPRKFLLPTEIEEAFDIGVNKVTVTVEEEKIPKRNVSELAQALQEFFEENSMGILRNEEVMLPVWKEGSVYFFLDPLGRDSEGEPKENSGASVLWFTTISSLASSIGKSFHMQPGEIVIDGVSLENEYETRLAEEERPKKTTSTENLWHHFPKKSEGIWEFQGKVSMQDERFPEENRGKQSAGVAVVSIIFSKVYEPRQWSPDVLDEVVITGDKLYTKSVARLDGVSSPRINEIIPEFFLSNRRIILKVLDCVESGKLFGSPSLQNLESGLDNFFKIFTSGVLTIKHESIDVNIAIWKARDHFFCVIPDVTKSSFSPESMTPHNVSVFRFNDTETLGKHLKSIFSPTDMKDDENHDILDYEISAVDVIDWNKFPPWKHDPSPAIPPSILPPLNAYKKLENPARAILSGGIHQGSDVFSLPIRNRQTAANCVVSLAMSVVKNPVTWTKKTLDEILVIGSGVHRESLKITKKEKLRPENITRVFSIGVNVLTADVDDSTISGQVALAPPEPEVKGKGKAKAKKKPQKAKKKKGKQKREPPPPPPIIFLEEGLKKFFENNRAGVLVTGRFMIAIWKDQGVYFLYDPRARNGEGLEDENGVSCVLWFACIEPYYDLIFANIDESEKYGRFDICRTVVRTNLIEPLPCPAGFQAFLDCPGPNSPLSLPDKRTITVDVEPLSNFKIVNDEIAVLNGSFSMCDRIFDIKTRGLQSTAMSAIAIVIGLLHIPSTWTDDLINSILKFGDILHKDSVRSFRTGARNLSPSELLTTFIIGDFKAMIHIHNHTVAGILLVDDLNQALSLFFNNNCAGILHTANYAVAVMQHYGMFYMFDPAERNENGAASYNGTACVIRSENLMRLAWIFVTNCNYKVPTVYTLNSVNVLNIKYFSDTNNCSPRCQK